MKLFNKTIDRQLFKQYSLGSDLSKQEVVVKIFNPQGRGNWFILNSDPEDPDYLWAIVDLGYGAEVGSVSRSDLETYRGKFGLGFERDLSFDPVNAEELYKGLRQGKYYAEGGGVDDYSDLYGQEVMALKNAKTQAKKTGYDYLVYLNKEGEISFARKNEFERFFDKEDCKILYSIDEKGNVTKMKPYADGGEVSFIDYNESEIMYEPHNKKYYANDVEFDSLQEAKDFIDSGETDAGIRDAYSKGLFAEGGNLRQSLEQVLKQDVTFLKFDSGRAYEKFSRLDIPFINVHDYDFNHYCIIKTENLEKVLDNVSKGVKVVKKKFSSDDLGFDYKGSTSFAEGGNIGKNLRIIEGHRYVLDRHKELSRGEFVPANLEQYWNVFLDKIIDNEYVKVSGFYKEKYFTMVVKKSSLLPFSNKKFAEGGNIENFSDNQQMIMNQNVELEHHHEELEDILEDEMPVPAWVVAKMATATQSISDVTHYLDGEKELMEEEDEEDDEDEDEDQDEIENKIVVEPIDVSAGTKTDLTKKFTDDAMGNLKGFLKGMEGVDLRDDYTFDYNNEQYEIEPIINSDENSVSNAVFTVFNGDGEEVGEVAYSREGGKQKFTANSEFFSWNNTKFEDGGFMNGVYADGGYFDGTIPKVSTYMTNYAEGGEIAKAEVFGLKRNIMGTTDIEMKISGMRKAQDFIVYPIGKDDAGSIITIQSETRIGKIDLTSGRGLMSQSHSNGAYFIHFQMDKLTPFTVSESDLENIKSHIFKTAGANVGTRGIVSDNSGASGIYANGGDLEDFINLKNKFIKKGFSVDYERADYIELFKSTDENDKNIGKYEIKKIGEKITISRKENGNLDVFQADYQVNGGGLSGQASKNKFYDLGDYRKINSFEELKFAKGGMVVTSIKDIPNFQERLNERKITYRGLGMGKLFDDFYKLAGTSGTRIKVDGKEYFITDEEFNSFSRGADGKLRVSFDAPARRHEDGGFMNNVYAKGGGVEKSRVYIKFLNKDKNFKEDTKYFDSYEKAVKWGRDNFERFDQDMIRYSKEEIAEKKYIDHADIKTVTVKRNGKEVTYKGADVLNGANILADGGDLTSKANYVPKRDIVGVELKDGTTIKPANGYWVKKGAEPIKSKQEFTSKDLPKDGSEIKITAPKLGNFPEIDLVLKYDSKNFRFDVYEDGVKKDVVGEKEVLNNLNNELYVFSNKSTPTSSSKSQSNISATEIRKDPRGNWRAETTIDDFNGYDWRLTTLKTYSGQLISSAQGGKTEDTGSRGVSMFKYTMYEDPYHTLEASKPTRLTEKVVTEQHEKALAKFKKFMETGMFKGGGQVSNFDKLSAKVAKQYEGKPVKSKYQEEYGKYYSKEEAQEVGDKVAGKVKAMQTDSKAFGGLFSSAKQMVTPKKYPELEGKQVLLKSGKIVQVLTQAGGTLYVIELGKLGTGIKPNAIDISEVDLTKLQSGGSVGTKRNNNGTETLKKANELAKKIRKDGESWLDAKKRAFAQLKK